MAGGNPIEVVRIRITAAGRRRGWKWLRHHDTDVPRAPGAARLLPSLARDRCPSTVSGFDVALSVYANSARGEWAW